MQRAVQRHYEGTTRVIPIILKPCTWEESPFSQLQVLPQDGKPVTRWDDRDEAFVNVEKGIRRVVDALNAEREEAAKLHLEEERKRQVEAARQRQQQEAEAQLERERQAAEQRRRQQEAERLQREAEAESEKQQQAEAQRNEQERREQEAQKQDVVNQEAINNQDPPSVAVVDTAGTNDKPTESVEEKTLVDKMTM
jgi:septal ring factor EnvC (AmiA/AmiB activator)